MFYTQYTMIGQSSEQFTSNELAESDWNRTKLLLLSDSVRARLRDGNASGLCGERLSSFLDIVLKDEERKHPTLDFDIIEYARLDKLLSELLQFADTIKPSNLAPELLLRFRVNVSQA